MTSIPETPYTEEQLDDAYDDALELSKELESERNSQDTDSTTPDLFILDRQHDDDHIDTGKVVAKRKRRNEGGSAKLTYTPESDFAWEVEQKPGIYIKGHIDFKAIDRKKFYQDIIDKYDFKEVTMAKLENLYNQRRTLMEK